MANTAKQHLQFKKYEQKQCFDRSVVVIFHQRGGHCQSIAWKTDLKCIYIMGIQRHKWGEKRLRFDYILCAKQKYIYI